VTEPDNRDTDPEQSKTLLEHLGTRGILLIVSIFFVLVAGVLIERGLRTDAPEQPPKPLPSLSSSFVTPTPNESPSRIG